MKKGTKRRKDGLVTGAIVTTGDALDVVQSVKKQIEKANAYEASIKILGKFHKSTGSTIREVIENLKPEGKAAGMAILTLSKGDKSKERILNGGQVMRLFSPSKLTREIALKNISNLFDL